MSISPHEVLTVPEAAKELKVSGRRIRQFIADGRLPARKAGDRCHLILRSDLDKVVRRKYIRKGT